MSPVADTLHETLKRRKALKFYLKSLLFDFEGSIPNAVRFAADHMGNILLDRDGNPMPPVADTLNEMLKRQKALKFFLKSLTFDFEGAIPNAVYSDN